MPKLTKNGTVKGRRNKLALVSTKKQRRATKRERRKTRPEIISNCECCGTPLRVWRDRSVDSYVCARGANSGAAEMVHRLMEPGEENHPRLVPHETTPTIKEPYYFCSKACADAYVEEHDQKPKEDQ